MYCIFICSFSLKNYVRYLEDVECLVCCYFPIYVAMICTSETVTTVTIKCLGNEPEEMSKAMLTPKKYSCIHNLKVLWSCT